MNNIKRAFFWLWAGLFRLIDWVCHWAIPALTTVSTVSGAFLTADVASLKRHYPNWDRQLDLVFLELPAIFLISACAGLALAWIQAISRRSVARLQRENTLLKQENEIIGSNILDLFNGYLYQLSGKLQFGTQHGFADRITLYVHDGNNSFVPFGRYSSNPNYGGPGRRTQYPDNQGCIAKGWEDGWHFFNTFGHTGSSYARICQQTYGIPAATLTELRMVSLMYGVKSIKNSSGRSVAVLVVESTKSDRFDENNLQQALVDQEGFLAELITKLEKHIPKPSDARRRQL